jgi:hopene-associated glycosyltransferase HpnB
MATWALYVLGASAVAWGYLGFFHHQFWRSNQILPPIKGRIKKWPTVTVIIPARNEEAVLGQTLPSVAGQEYPGKFQAILVNDNSNDATSKIAEKVKGVQVLNAKPLEPGWAGKLWAMKQGVDLAHKKFPATDYFWFTDADIEHQPDVLAGLVEAAKLDNRAMVSQMVMLHCKSFWERAFIPAFIFFFEMLYPFKATNSDKSKISGAAGGCILLEKKWLTKIGGIERIKTALIDDCAMAAAVKGDGGRIWLGFGLNSKSIRPYSFSDFWTTVARTAFTQLKNSSLLLIGTILAMAVVFLAPPGLAVWGIITGELVVARTGIILWGFLIFFYAPTLMLYKLHPIRGYALPFVAILYLLMTIHSALRFWRGKACKENVVQYKAAYSAIKSNNLKLTFIPFFLFILFLGFALLGRAHPPNRFRQGGFPNIQPDLKHE